MNFSEYKIYIEKICTMANNFFIYDQEYIKSKYNLSSYNEFRKYFKKTHRDKLIFNSSNAENFFIKIMNLNSQYMNKKYKDSQSTILIDFFINKTFNSFNICEEITNQEKTHIVDCDCKIKVKSVVNLSIGALVFILMDYNTTNKLEKLVQLEKNTKNLNQSVNLETKIIKIPNNTINKKLVESIKQIKLAKNNLGLIPDNTFYELTDTIHTYNNVITEQINDTKEDSKIISSHEQINDTKEDSKIISSPESINNSSPELKPININKYNEQLISETEQSDTENNSKTNITNIENYSKINITNIENYSKTNTTNIENDFINKNLDFVKSDSSNNSDSLDKIDNSKSSIQTFSSSNNKNSTSESMSSEKKSNKYGKVILQENKVKLEKKEPVDLKNSSDIMISYNEHVEQLEKQKKSEKLERGNNYIIQNPNTKIKSKVIEVLEYLNKNFNYITSDDILIDKDKKMQICTFMVEVKYEIYGMFRNLEKHMDIPVQQKNKILSDYEHVYQYVVKSNKIGNTGEMISFNNNKELVEIIIKDIQRI